MEKRVHKLHRAAFRSYYDVLGLRDARRLANGLPKKEKDLIVRSTVLLHLMAPFAVKAISYIREPNVPTWKKAVALGVGFTLDVGKFAVSPLAGALIGASGFGLNLVSGAAAEYNGERDLYTGLPRRRLRR